MSDLTTRASELARLEHGASLEEALRLFDASPAVQLDEMTGQWKGTGVPTGHPMDGLLEATGWYGKRFTTTENVHPLLFTDARGQIVSVNPAFMPMGLPPRAFDVVRSDAGSRIARPLTGLLRTRRPAARLRMVEYRGVQTATMIYDALPINDHFRRIDENTVLGAMDYRKTPAPFMFALRRVDTGEASR